MDPRIADALGRFDFTGDAHHIPHTLPLLEALRAHRPHGGIPARSLLVIQHQLATNVPLVRALIDDGCDPEQTWFVDIPYSTHLDVRDALADLVGGDDRFPAVFDDPLADYTAAQLMRVVTTMLRMVEHGHHRNLLVLDDGAYFLRALTVLEAISHPAAQAFPGTALVEQTTRGHEFVRTHTRELAALGIRAVSIARTDTKLEVESPFIGASVAAALDGKVAQLRPDGVGHWAVLGFGAIGEACVAQLRRRLPGAAITIVDGSPTHLDAARATYPEANAVPTLPAAGGGPALDLVVGCTGRNSFTLQDRHLLASDAILASGSSAAIEFDRAGFVDLADYRPDDAVELLFRQETLAAGIHADITMRLDNGTVTFVNAGFPVNFNGRRECLPEPVIQPTRCLMYAAAHQAARSSDPGMGVLDQGIDHWIREEGIAMLASAVV